MSRAAQISALTHSFQEARYPGCADGNVLATTASQLTARASTGRSVLLVREQPLCNVQLLTRVSDGIVRRDSHIRKSGVTRPGIEPESPWWEASRLTAQPPRRFHISPGRLEFGSIGSAPTRFGAAVAERLARSPPTKANRAQFPAGPPDSRKWESCRTMPLVGGPSRGYPASPTPSFQICSIFTSITLIDSQDLAVLSRPNLFTSLRYFLSCSENNENSENLPTEKGVEKDYLRLAEPKTTTNYSENYLYRKSGVNILLSSTISLSKWCPDWHAHRKEGDDGGRSGLAARAPSSDQGEPGSIHFRTWGSCRTMTLVSGVFSGISRFARPSHFGEAPYSPHFTLIGSQDLVTKSRLNLCHSPLNSVVRCTLVTGSCCVHRECTTAVSKPQLTLQHFLLTPLSLRALFQYFTGITAVSLFLLATCLHEKTCSSAGLTTIRRFRQSPVRQSKATHDSPSSVDPSGQKMFSVTTQQQELSRAERNVFNECHKYILFTQHNLSAFLLKIYKLSSVNFNGES
ncbi:hypothetical protein PR048_003546 [Dryococelus australis]|uniref:Uncharacterized protein n=1 Tax=Dryococelus australis TaxID=614101 RepID=A0ABQ9IND5_9NEOP|nr:hypothetical protein PR048_003546 [Dryococelus australis]